MCAQRCIGQFEKGNDKHLKGLVTRAYKGNAAPIYMAYTGKVPREKLQDASPDDQKTLRGIAVSVICPALDVRAFLADMMVLSLTALLRH